MGEAVWTQRVCRWAGRLAGTALLVGGAGLALARYDLVPKIFGLYAMGLGGLMAVLGLVLAVIGLGMTLRNKSITARPALLGLIVGLGFLGFGASFTGKAGTVPPIHDITTDTANPPAFRQLELRADNLAGVGSIEKWRELHAQAYGDIKPLDLPCPVGNILGKAEQHARDMGWSIALVDPAAGRLEATDSVSLIRYYDDIIVQITPQADPARCRVDMRSVSRVGQSDLGVNAKRVRAFLAVLKAG